MRDIERLVDGFQRFQHQYYEEAPSLYRNLRDGQHPSTLLVGCCDSRVDPAMLLGCDPGDIFTVRNVANLIPPYEQHGGTQHGTSAALEFGVQALHVKHIVVLGHAHCGGIRAFADDQEPLSPGDFIGRWMSQIAPAAAALGPNARYDPEAFRRRLEFASVELSLENLMTFPFVRKAVESGHMRLHGAYFGVAEGTLYVLDRETKEFRSVRDNSLV